MSLTLPRPFRRSQHPAAAAILSNPSPDAAVIATNSDAAISKASCVRKGYYEDEFLKHFVADAASPCSTSTSTSSSSSLPKRPPLINRGYFCRHAAVSGLVAAFLSRVAKSSKSPSPPDSPPPRAQVVSLGAGSDTLFFRLHAAGRAADLLFVELDLPEVVSRKAETIASTAELAAVVGLLPPPPPTLSGPPSPKRLDRIVTSRYALLPCDLRGPSPISTAIRQAQEEQERSSTSNCPSSSSSSSSDKAFAFDPCAPTLFVSECVLVYLPPEAGDEVLRDAFEMLKGGGGGKGEGGGGKGEGGEEGTGGEGAVVVFDPCRPETAFGRQMAANLRARGCELPGIGAAKDPGAAAARLRRIGWECGSGGGGGGGGGGAGERVGGGGGGGGERVGGGGGGGGSAADLGAVWDRLLPREACAHASRIERLDELEEFNLIMEHYFLAVGVRRGKGNVLEGFGLASINEL